MENNDISKDILSRIKEENITPKPRWAFLLRDCALWIVGGICVFIGGLAFAVILYMFRTSHWSLLSEAGGSTATIVFASLPYVWFLCLFLFLGAAYYNVKHTKRGYKWNLFTMMGGLILLSIVFGILLYVLGVARATDEVLIRRAPIYARVMHPNQRVWMHPEKGLLTGVIIEIHSSSTMDIQDIQRKLWNVVPHEMFPESFSKLTPGLRIMMVGERKGDACFEVKQMALPGPKKRVIQAIIQRQAQTQTSESR
ncbi:MAG: hypothetical protein ABII02_04885 [Candidatus Magasanikbacteria bacterium]